MSLATRLDAPLPADLRSRLRGRPGDILVMAADGARIPRTGTIVAVIGPAGSPPYRVRWLAGDYESLVFPGPGAHVEAHQSCARSEDRLGGRANLPVPIEPERDPSVLTAFAWPLHADESHHDHRHTDEQARGAQRAACPPGG